MRECRPEREGGRARGKERKGKSEMIRWTKGRREIAREKREDD